MTSRAINAANANAEHMKMIKRENTFLGVLKATSAIESIKSLSKNPELVEFEWIAHLVKNSSGKNTPTLGRSCREKDFASAINYLERESKKLKSLQDTAKKQDAQRLEQGREPTNQSMQQSTSKSG